MCTSKHDHWRAQFLPGKCEMAMFGLAGWIQGVFANAFMLQALSVLICCDGQKLLFAWKGRRLKGAAKHGHPEADSSAVEYSFLRVRKLLETDIGSICRAGRARVYPAAVGRTDSN